MRLDGKGAYLRPLSLTDTNTLLRLRVANREFLAPFEPLRNERFYTLEGQREQIEASMSEWDSDRGYGFGIFTFDEEMVGRVALSNVVRGAWQNTTLGYFVAEGHGGKGYATEAVRLALDFAFGSVHLHRVQAGVMPRNVASAKVLRNNGFRLEGTSPRYLKINGEWEDHDLYALTAEEWPPTLQKK